ncbi:MAG TPA: DUF6569 family protein [Pyrinomonadaceae bacterium]|nr:DUF6569 family protein [Pyrinomonadaceae bacterium]
MKFYRYLGVAAVAVLIALSVTNIQAQTGYKISAPYAYKNLTIFLIHGKNETSKTNIITLQEAMNMKVLRVFETSDVNELSVENISKQYDVFIQSGDIVKGGKQDRVLAISIIIPARSGRVSIEAFCVESGRWEKRKGEDAQQFSSSEERIVSKDLKVAANGARSQSEVWSKVAEAQKRLSANIGVDVTANASGTSLQLALENGKVAATAEQYVQKLMALTAGKPDVIGYAFAVNGEINSADIYVSNHLFKKLWPKMLKAAAIEAVAEGTTANAAAAPKPAAIQSFLSDAEKGIAKERPTSGKSKVVTRESDGNTVYEARDKSDLVVHRNYVKMN